MNEDPIKLWQHFHGATVHFPIALAIVSAAFDVGSLIFKKPAWRVVGFWTLIAAIASTIAAAGTGLYYIYGDVDGKKAFAEGLTQATVVLHRNLGLAGGSLLLLAGIIRSARRDELPRAAHVICVLMVVVAAALIGYTGFKGAYVRMGY